jgi:hypothetical protein
MENYKHSNSEFLTTIKNPTAIIYLLKKKGDSAKQ